MYCLLKSLCSWRRFARSPDGAVDPPEGVEEGLTEVEAGLEVDAALEEDADAALDDDAALVEDEALVEAGLEEDTALTEDDREMEEGVTAALLFPMTADDAIDRLLPEAALEDTARFFR